MADVIKTIGASGSGADFANYQTWFAARTGGASITFTEKSRTIRFTDNPRTIKF